MPGYFPLRLAPAAFRVEHAAASSPRPGYYLDTLRYAGRQSRGQQNLNVATAEQGIRLNVHQPSLSIPLTCQADGLITLNRFRHLLHVALLRLLQAAQTLLCRAHHVISEHGNYIYIERERERTKHLQHESLDAALALLLRFYVSPVPAVRLKIRVGHVRQIGRLGP